MNAKNTSKFKKPEEYQTPVTEPSQPVVREVFFRLKPMPASLVQYAVEQVTLENDVVIERKNVTERDVLLITMSKLEDFVIRQVRK